MNINDLTILSDIENINISDVKVGHQFLIMQKYYDENLKGYISNFNTYVIEKIDSNIITMYSNVTTYKISTDKTEINATINNSKNRIYLLMINNKVMTIDRYISYGTDFHEKLKHFSTTIKDIPNFSYEHSNEDLLRFNFSFSCPVNENIYFIYLCQNNIKNYDWRMTQEYFIFNKEKQICFHLNGKLNTDKLIGLLEQLDCNKNSSEFDKFKETYKMVNYDIKDYLNDNSILEEIKNFYSIIPELSDKIDKFFEPIYQNEDFKSYLNTRYNHYDEDNECINIILNKKNVEINKRIAKTIKIYLLRDTMINPYTGELLSDNHEKIYEDAEHVIIESKNRNINYYYIKYNNIFIRANKEEKNEILELYETINKLTS